VLVVVGLQVRATLGGARSAAAAVAAAAASATDPAAVEAAVGPPSCQVALPSELRAAVAAALAVQQLAVPTETWQKSWCSIAFRNGLHDFLNNLVGDSAAFQIVWHAINLGLAADHVMSRHCLFLPNSQPGCGTAVLS
jgi:hypothetical protein